MRYQRQVLLVFFGIAVIASLVLNYQNLNPGPNNLSIYDDVPIAIAIAYDETRVIHFDNVTHPSSVVLVGNEYGASACWLEPAWGTRMTTNNQFTTNTTTNNDDDICIGEKPPFSNTTATYLTCRDKPTKKKNTHQQPSDDHYHPGLTIALLYFAKPAMLFRQLANFASYPEDIRQHLTILIIDDGSPEGLKATDYLDIHQYDSQFRLRFARIITEKPWNIGGARNLAFYLADTQTALFLDLDVLIPMETMKVAMTWETRNQTNTLAHRFNRRRPDGTTGKHPAICVLDVDAYWESGGCDEDFCGKYGYTDVHFWFRWKADPTRLKLDHLDTYLIEFEQRACDEAYITEDADMQKCKLARSKLKKGRELKSNHAVYKRKTNEGCWSNKYLRFRWVLEK